MLLRNGKIKYNNILDKIESILPPELLFPIVNYHHCMKCNIEDSQDMQYCRFCGIDKHLRIFRICKDCDKGIQDINLLSNKQFHTHCKNCIKPLVKLVYCERVKNIDLDYDKYYYVITYCEMCKIKKISIISHKD